MAPFEGVVSGFPGDSTSGTIFPLNNDNYDSFDNADNNNFDNSDNNASAPHNDYSNVVNLLEPPATTSADHLFSPVPGFEFDTDRILSNFQDFSNDPGHAMAPAQQYQMFNPGQDGREGAPNSTSNDLNQSHKPGAAMEQQGLTFNYPLFAMPSPGGRTNQNFSHSLVPGVGGNAYVQQQSQGFDVGAAAPVSVAPPFEEAPFPDAVGPAATSSFVRPAYINLEVNRLAQPGPVSHPDKNFRPYGTNNWHVILHDHTLLRYLSNSEIKEIRDHAGDLASASLEEDDDNAHHCHHSAVGGGGGVGGGQSQPRLIGDGPYHTDDATQVWRYCQAYLSRRGQMRNNNAARRSRMKKESETRYWKTLALRAGVADHEYEFTEEEEEAAIARAEMEKAQAEAAAAEAAGDNDDDQQNPRKRSYSHHANNKGAAGRGRGGRRAAKKPAAARLAATAGSASASLGGVQSYDSPPHGLSMSLIPAGSQNVMPGDVGQLQNYQGHVPAQQQLLYDHHQPGPHHLQQQTTQEQIPQHRFNTRSRTRASAQAGLPASGVTYGYDTFTNTPTTAAAPEGNSNLSPPSMQSPGGGAAAGGNPGAQANHGQEDQSNWMDVYLNL